MTPADSRAAFASAVALLVAVLGEAHFAPVYFAASLVFTALTAWWTAKPGNIRLVTAEKASLIFLCWASLAAAMASGNLFASKMTLASWAAAWLIWALGSRAGRLGRRMTGIFVVAGAILVAAGLLAEFAGFSGPRVGGLAGNPSLTAALIIPVIPLVPSIVRHRLAAATLVVFLAGSIVLTGSRAGLLALAVVAAISFPPRRWRGFALGTGFLAIAAALVWRLTANPEPLAWHRLHIWRAVLDMISDHPIWGIGLADLGEAAGPYRLAHNGAVGVWGHVIGSAENVLLGIAVRTGLIGLCIAATGAALWVRGLRFADRSVVATVAAIAAVSAFHDFLAEPAVLWWWAAVTAVITPRRHSIAEGGSEGASFRPFVCLALSGVAAWLWVQPALAEFVAGSSPKTPATVRRVMRMEPWFETAMRWRLERLLRTPDWSWEDVGESVDWSHRLVTVTPGAASAWNLRASVLSRAVEEFGAWPGTVAEARTAFQAAHELEPHLPWYPYRWALLERRVGNLGEARRLALLSVESEPAFVRGRLLLARLALDRGDVEAARIAYDRARRELNRPPVFVRSSYEKDLLEAPERQLASLEEEIH